MRFRGALEKLNNKAFSLIELVVVVALLGIMGTGLVAFMAVSMKHYRNDSADINIQTQAQMAANQLENLILDASNGVCYSLSTDTGTGVATKSLQLFSFDFDRQAKVREQIYKDSNTSFLYYVRDEKTADAWNRVDTSQLFATYIDTFDVTIYDAKGNDITGTSDTAEAVQVEVRFKYSHGGREYEENRLVTLRNRVILNSDEDRIFDDISDQTIPTVRQVFLSLLQDGRLWVGETYTGLFETSLIGNNTSQLTDYEVYNFAFGNPLPSDAATTLAADGSSLTLNINEKNDFQIVATSKASEDLGTPKSAAVKIYPRYISGGSIIGLEATKDNPVAVVTIGVVVHNGVGDEAERDLVLGTLSQKLVMEHGQDSTNWLKGFVYQDTVIRGNSVTYVFKTETNNNIPYNQKFTYTVEGTGKGKNWTDSKTFNIKDLDTMKGTFELFSDTASATSNVVYPGETIDIYGGYILEVDEYKDEVYPIRPDDTNLTLSVTTGSEYFSSVSFGADGKLTLKKQNQINFLDENKNVVNRDIVISATYVRGVNTYNKTYHLTLKPVEVKVVQPYKTGTIKLNVDAGHQSRELLPYDATAEFVYDMAGIQNVSFLIDISCADSNITCTNNSDKTRSSIKFAKKIEPNNKDPYQADTTVKFAASMVIKDSNGQNLPAFDTGAVYEMALTYGNLNVFTGNGVDWNVWGGDKYKGIRSWINKGNITVSPVCGAFVPNDLPGGRYLTVADQNAVEAAHPFNETINNETKDKQRIKAVLDVTEMYNLVVSCETPPASGSNRKYVRIGIKGSSSYSTSKTHPLVDVLDYYDGAKQVLSVNGNTPDQSFAGRVISWPDNVDIKGWYAHYTD